MPPQNNCQVGFTHRTCQNLILQRLILQPFLNSLLLSISWQYFPLTLIKSLESYNAIYSVSIDSPMIRVITAKSFPIIASILFVTFHIHSILTKKVPLSIPLCHLPLHLPPGHSSNSYYNHVKSLNKPLKQINAICHILLLNQIYVKTRKFFLHCPNPCHTNKLEYKICHKFDI